MFNIEIPRMIQCIREQLFTFHFQRPTEGLHFGFDVILATTDPQRSNILIKREHSVEIVLCGNTNVWFTSKKFDNFPAKIADFENTSNHDSCWCSDGIKEPLNRIYFDIARSINSELQKKLVPADMNASVRMRRMMRIVVKHCSDPRDEHGYLRLLEGFSNI